MSRLDGKTVVLTGAAGGIGRPLATRLRDLGATVVGVARSVCPTCDDTWLHDLADDAALDALVERLSALAPDILVNLAGMMKFGLHESHARADLDLLYRVNLVVPSVLAQAVAGPMRARGSGQIVNVGSVLGAIPYPWFAAYSSSKAGLAALSQALQRELSGTGVTVTHVNPRAAKTPFNDEAVNRFLNVTGMVADEPEDVATAIAKAIAARRNRATIGRSERVFSTLNALAPGMIDNGLKSQIGKARKAFSF